MLVLSRKVGEQICVPPFGIVLTVLAVNGRRVRLGIAAPEKSSVDRKELRNRAPQHHAHAVALHPESKWRIIVDQLNTHWSASLVWWVIAMENLTLPPDELGVKGESGILKNQASRQAFLTATERHIRFIYVPKHSSWLNQVEIWFSVVVRRVIQRGHFVSVEALRQRLLDFIDYFNRTMAKPYRWTFTGQPLTK